MPFDLKAGQIWHANNPYFHISIVGKTLVHYRMLKKLDRRAAAAHIANRQELTAYLKRNKAEEVSPPPAAT